MKVFDIIFHSSGVQSELERSMLISYTRSPRAVFRTKSDMCVAVFINVFR
jgi:hypothetical protein